MDPVAIVTTAIGSVTDGVEGVAVPALALGAAIFALSLAWRKARAWVK